MARESVKALHAQRVKCFFVFSKHGRVALGRLFTGVSVGFFSGCVFMKFSSPFKAKVFYSFIIPYTRAKYKFFVEISQEFNADSRHLIAFHQEKLYNR